MRRSTQLHFHPLKSFGQVQHHRDRSRVLFTRFAITSFHLEQRFPNGALRPSIGPSSGIPPNTMSFLPSRHLKRTQPLPPTNQRGQKRDGTFAREVLRNLEEHRRARLLRPSPTLINLRGLRSMLCILESHCQCFAHSFLFSSPLFMGLAPSSNLSTPANHLSMLLASGFCATSLLLLPHWKSAGWTASDAPLLPSFLILAVLFMKRTKTLIAASCPPILGGATFFPQSAASTSRTHQLCSAFILDLPNHTCHV